MTIAAGTMIATIEVIETDVMTGMITVKAAAMVMATAEAAMVKGEIN